MGNGLQGKKEINQQSDELIQWWEAEDFFMHWTIVFLSTFLDQNTGELSFNNYIYSGLGISTPVP